MQRAQRGEKFITEKEREHRGHREGIIEPKSYVEDGKAVGIRLENGEEHRAGRVISAADGYTTIFKMLEGKYVDETVRMSQKLPGLENFHMCGQWVEPGGWLPTG